MWQGKGRAAFHEEAAWPFKVIVHWSRRMVKSLLNMASQGFMLIQC
jgi:hypothetical protein